MPSTKKAQRKPRASRKTIFKVAPVKNGDGLSITIPQEAVTKAGLTTERLFLTLSGGALQISAKKPALVLPLAFFDAFGKQKERAGQAPPANEEE